MTLLPRDMTTSLRVADLERAIYPLRLTVIAFILAELWRGEGTIHPPPHGPRRLKNPVYVDRV